MLAAGSRDVTYAIVFIENGDVVADFDVLDEARDALHDFVAEHPRVGERVGLLAFDERGRPTGEFLPAHRS